MDVVMGIITRNRKQQWELRVRKQSAVAEWLLLGRIRLKNEEFMKTTDVGSHAVPAPTKDGRLRPANHT